MIARLWEDCPQGWDKNLTPEALAFFMGRTQVRNPQKNSPSQKFSKKQPYSGRIADKTSLIKFQNSHEKKNEFDSGLIEMP